MTNCGAGRESCCTTLEVPGGTYFRTYTPNWSGSGSAPPPESDPATVSSFRLDKYEVTVGRFRQFVSAWDGGSGYTPQPGAGKHAHLNGGLGLANSGSPGTYEPGWMASDDRSVAPTDANLACKALYVTWTASPANDETLPIDCVTWYEAYAFCIWDGGFLPSEAEWEYAAAGGSQQRKYPWGSTDPGAGHDYAIYGDGSGMCSYPGPGLVTCTGVANIAPVGSADQGAGAWGQLDLAGNVWEWNLDYYAPYVAPCLDCADLAPAPSRAVRGGYFYVPATILLPSNRNGSDPGNRSNCLGWRCSRGPTR
jgi:formylglycine-generating enzyme required for sulfatase activity